jgi:fructose-1,6-bisphosphatase-3
MMLKKIDRQGNIFIGGICYALKDRDFKNIKRTLTEKEKNLIIYLKEAFCGSEKLQRHVRFLYEKGSMYRIYNGNLLFHGCIPLDRDGEFLHLGAANGAFGKGLMDICDKKAREGYFSKDIKIKKTGEDFLWFLWCGKNSPLSAREKIAAFERLLISEKVTHSEPKNSYYLIWKDGKIAEKILNEFGLHSTSSKIINGHIPVNKGEDPVKSDGRLILIDGGFCRAYHDVTGIAGYTLIYNADGMKLFAHNAFPGKVQVLNGKAMHEATEIVLEKRLKRMRIRDCDRGAEIREELCDLLVLLEKYKSGLSK